MEKRNVIEIGRSPCDEDARTTAVIKGKKALPAGKTSGKPTTKSFTEPLDIGRK